MKRLFWGIPALGILEAEGREQIRKVKIAARKRGIEVKWSPPESFHITLVFVGESEENIINEMVEKVRRVCEKQSPFDVILKGAGAFPDPQTGRLLYVGVKAKQELTSLQGKVLKAVRPYCKLEEREFRPHMTLGRLKSGKNLKDVLSPMERKNFGAGEVKEVVLFESVTGGPFPRYTALAKLALKGDV